MNKVFLYLYPIKEYTSIFVACDEYYKGKTHPLNVLNECIEKRYRKNGYQVVFFTYPDRELYGIDLKDQDKVVYTEIKFQDNSAIDDLGKKKIDFIPKYPDEKRILFQLGDIDELRVGGYHFSDCVRKVAEKSLELGIDTLVDLDLTDLFFSLYHRDDYFVIDEYNKERYKEFWIKREQRYSDDKNDFEKQFMYMYDSPSYGFQKNKAKKLVN